MPEKPRAKSTDRKSSKSSSQVRGRKAEKAQGRERGGNGSRSRKS